MWAVIERHWWWVGGLMGLITLGVIVAGLALTASSSPDNWVRCHQEEADVIDSTLAEESVSSPSGLNDSSRERLDQMVLRGHLAQLYDFEGLNSTIRTGFLHVLEREREYVPANTSTSVFASFLEHHERAVMIYYENDSYRCVLWDNDPNAG
jgi:hypothetical protein